MKTKYTQMHQIFPPVPNFLGGPDTENPTDPLSAN